MSHKSTIQGLVEVVKIKSIRQSNIKIKKIAAI